MNITTISYRPNEEEEYMNAQQLDYFRALLLRKREELTQVVTFAKSDLKEKKERSADIFDIAATSAEFSLGIGDMERTRKNIGLIDKALIRIDTGEYGYCNLSGEKIGIKRLQAQPAALLCVEVQEMLERGIYLGGDAQCCSSPL